MKNFKESLLSVLAGIVLSLIITSLLGESPITIIKTMYYSVFSSFDQLSYVLFYTTPLIFTGLSVAVAFHAGLFNIGSEGQLYIGSLFTTFFSLTFLNLPSFFAITGAILFAFLGGGLWAAIAGFLKAKRGSHEVIVTIMLNFISYAVCGYFILGAFKNPHSQNPESAEIGLQYHLHRFSGDAPLNAAIFLAIFCAILTWLLLYKTNWGFEVRLIGSSLETARRSGINIKRRLIEAMFLSGGLAGLVGVHEILGHAYKFKDQFSNGLGFVGIAVALLARNKPLMVLFSALLFGALSKSALDLELDTEKITRDMALIIQGLIILFVAASQRRKNAS
ncbi:MAG: ABC transporter permease [Oligoflexia bacterium]|nr:ABC transporter permease [Oligoflexia bacterium]